MALLTELGLIFTIIFLIFLLLKFLRKISKLKSKIKSQAIIHGLNIEEIVPFTKNFKYDYREFKFLGKPIEGIVFAKDRIVFIEIKTGNSQLSEKQKSIKQLVDNKKVYWEEIRIN